MQWKANWIWIKGKKKPKNFYLSIRKSFRLKEIPEKGTLYISADSRYKLYFNGNYIGRGPAKCDPAFQYYDTYNITNKLRKGKNLIAVLVHHYGEETFSYLLGRGGFLCQLEVQHKNGQREIIVSDKTWKIKQKKSWNQDAPRTTVQMGYQEIYDAGKEMVSWQNLGFDDSNWEKPVVIGVPPIAPWKKMIPRDIPYLSEKEIYPQEITELGECPQPIDLNNIKNIAALMEKELHLPQNKNKIKGLKDILKKDKKFLEIKVSKNSNFYLLLDFGREVSGFPKIYLEGVSGGIVDFGYDEVLIDKRIHPARGGGSSSRIKYSDRYVMKNGYQEYEQAFTWRGFRYLQLVFRNCSKAIKLYGVSLNYYVYPAKYRGAFACSDPMLNKIWEVGRDTLQMCMHDSYEDCPWREQAQWWGDARVQGLVNYYCFGDKSLFKKGLRQIAESQVRRSDGLMQPFAPGGTYGSSIHLPMKVIPSFCLVWILSLYDYYLYTGDTQPIRGLYPNLKVLLKTFEDSLSKRNLTTLSHWQFIDWAPLDTKGENTALNCFLYEGLLKATEIALLNGDKAFAIRYQRLARRVKDGINKYLFSKTNGLYADGYYKGRQSRTFSQQSNCLAVLFDIAPQEKQRTIINKILEAKDVIKITTPYFMFYFLSALLHIGKHTLVKDIIREKWGEMIGKGATTFWEDFAGIDAFHKGGSLCHAWSACPTALLSQEILGVRPIEPGFKRVLVEPHFFNLAWAKGIIPTASGNIKVSWEIKTLKGKRILNFKLLAPKKCQGEVVIPEEGKIKRYKFSNGKFFRKIKI